MRALWLLGCFACGGDTPTDATDSPLPTNPTPTGTRAATADSGTVSKLVPMEPHLQLPVNVCFTQAFVDAFGKSEGPGILSHWEAVAPKVDMFRVVACDAKVPSLLVLNAKDVPVIEITRDAVRYELHVSTGSNLLTDDELGGCTSEMSSTRLLTHEVGHALGLPHSCEMGAPCEGDAEAALMHWHLPSCTSTTVGTWDEDALVQIHGL